MRTHLLKVLAAAVLGALPMTTNAVHRALFEVPLYGVTFFGDELIEIEPATGGSRLVAKLGEPVSGYGLASRYGRLYSFNPVAGGIIEINPLTGSVNQTINVGVTNAQGEGDLAFRSDGTLFLTTALDRDGAPTADLFAVDVLGGSSRRIGSTGIAIDALAFGHDGTNEFLYALGQGQGKLYRIDQTNGVPMEVGSLGVPMNSPFAGLTFAPDGSLYAAIDDRLYQVDPFNGAAQVVNTNVLNIGYGSVSGLTFQSGAPDRELLGLSFFSGQLVRVDPGNGAATLIGTASRATNQPAISGFGLAALGDRLYTFDGNSDRVHEIDPASGAVLSTNNIGIGNVQGEGDIAIRADGIGVISAALDGAGNPASALYSFDLATGTSTNIGSPGVPLDALAFDHHGTLFALAQHEGKLYTVNQTNAALTLVGTNLGVAMNSPFAALTFTADRRLVAAIDDRLYNINTISGRATAIDTNINYIGFSSISGLASVQVRRLGIEVEDSRVVVFANGLESRIEAAADVTGPYSPIMNQTNLLVITNSGPREFFRLRRP